MHFFSRIGVLTALAAGFLFSGSAVLAAAPPNQNDGSIPANGPLPGQQGYDPQNTCEYVNKWICREACLSSEIEEKSSFIPGGGSSSISCGLKAQQGKTKCCHAKNFKSGTGSPSNTTEMKNAAAGKTEGELNSSCAQAGGICQPADPELVAQGISPCSGDQQISAFCSADGKSVCCTKAAAAVNQQVGACVKAGGSCLIGSCPSGYSSIGICDSSEDAYCCKPDETTGAGDVPVDPANPNAVPPPPNPFDDKKPAGFDDVKKHYQFQDPLNLQGQNKFPKLVNRLISWFLPITGALFMAVIVYAGILWLSAAGDDKQVSKARTYLTNAVIGMMLIVFSYAIVVNLINYFGNAAFGPGAS
jgi:hypothetical protein